MLTVYILPGGTEEQRTRLVKSLVPVKDCKIVAMNQDKFDLYNGADHGNPWYAMFYGYEYLEKCLADVIPIYLFDPTFNFYIMLKKESARDKGSWAPRIFRNYINLEPDCLMPIATDLRSTSTVILDGFILQDD